MADDNANDTRIHTRQATTLPHLHNGPFKHDRVPSPDEACARSGWVDQPDTAIQRRGHAAGGQRLILCPVVGWNAAAGCASLLTDMPCSKGVCMPVRMQH
eukprot:363075-Chlamydomonas_euryale.AAC.1